MRRRVTNEHGKNSVPENCSRSSGAPQYIEASEPGRGARLAELGGLLQVVRRESERIQPTV